MHDVKTRIGSGKIGGKSAGMLLAWKILQQTDQGSESDLSGAVDIPDSYFIASEVIYEFRLMNKLETYMNQKYRPLEEIKADYPMIVEKHIAGTFPDQILDQLRAMLRAWRKDVSARMMEPNPDYVPGRRP